MAVGEGFGRRWGGGGGRGGGEMANRVMFFRIGCKMLYMQRSTFGHGSGVKHFTMIITVAVAMRSAAAAGARGAGAKGLLCEFCLHAVT